MIPDHIRFELRRHFLGRASRGLGAAALAGLFARPESHASDPAGNRGLVTGTHFAPRARRAIYLFMSGGPAQMDLFDHKPTLREMNGQEMPKSVIGTQRLTTMTRSQTTFPIAGSQFSFSRYGDADLELSNLLPHTSTIVDRIAVIRSMVTEPINHDPAVMYLQSGSSVTGRPCLGSWLSYGLGTETENMPAFVVLLSGPARGGQPLLSKYWHSGFLPSRHQGAQFQSAGEPVMGLANPDGVSREDRRRIVTAVNQLNQIKLESVADPEIEARINAFELAFQMQTTVPEITDLANEPQHILDMYGAEPGKASFANNCLLARRMIERGVRFVELFDKDWDHHGDLPQRLRAKCQDVDKACCRAHQGSCAAGTIGRYPCDLGRRVWPNSVLSR